MQHRSPSLRTAPIHRRRAAGLLAAGLALTASAGCGSSDGGTSAKADPTEFCTAVAQYVDATKAGDRTDMADALAGSIDGLPAEGERAVQAYVLALRGAPANHSPDEDGVTSDRTQEAFDAFVAKECGDDAIPSGSSTTTSTTAAETSTTVAAGDQGSGTDGSTGDAGNDSQADSGTGSGSGSGTGSGSGSGTGSDSGSGTGSGGGSGTGSGDAGMDSGSGGGSGGTGSGGATG